MPSADRAAFVAGAVGDDDSLCWQVQELLDSAATRDDALERPAVQLLGSDAPSASLASGSRVGAYRVLELVGRGGMGEVYRAERADGQFRQQVAVKLIRREAVEQLALFEIERRTLAQLDHPGIARLFDGGVAEDGRPFMVMEWVEGSSITQWCRETGADLRRRLEIFLQVCDAVAYAHRNLLVHRDIKPANVLVTAAGRSKLLDFGVAKLLSDVTDDQTQTQAPMTLAYAAPEQLDPGPITTATDVYALGLLLFELLTGERLWQGGQQPLAQLIQRQQRSSAPAASVTAASLAAPPVAAKLLRGDLDAIVGLALRIELPRRYRSAAELGDDLRRYLDRRPVLARPESATYALAKFARRNRASTAFGALALVALLGGAALALWQAREAAIQRDAAWLQLARATATNEFMGFLLSVAAPAGQKFSVGELLEAAEVLADRQFAGNPALRAELLAAIGQHYMSAERWDRARPVLERAAAAAAQSPDPGLRARTQCPLALLLILNGQRSEAEAMMQQALAQLPDDAQYRLQRAECLTRYSEFGFFTGQAEPMIRHAAAAMMLLEQVPIESASRWLDAQAAQAYGFYLARQNRRADAAYSAVVAGLEAAGRAQTSAAADVLNNWALVHFQSDPVKTEPLCRRVVELRRLIEGAAGIAPTATFNLAGVLMELARFDEARSLLQETVRTATARQEYRIQTDATMRLADLYTRTGDLQRAGEQLTALEPLMSSPRFDHLRRAQLAYTQGQLAQARGDLATARGRYGEAVARFDQSTAKIALNVSALIGLARVQQASGEKVAAAGSAAQALALAQSFIEPGQHFYLVGLSRTAQAELLLENGEPDAARGAFRDAAVALRQTLGAEHPAAKAARQRLAQLPEPTT